LWSNGDTTEDINGLTAGVYAVSVSDGNVCNTVDKFAVTEPDTIGAASSLVVNPSCAEMDDGRVELVVTGGTSPYTYQWSTGSTVSTLEDIAAGDYSVTITDINGCTGSGTFTLDATACNLPPIAVDDIVKNSTGQSTDIAVLNNDSDPDNDNINVTGIIDEPANGTTTINADGTITYTPYNGFVGEDAFTYIICDDGDPELCDTAIVFITSGSEKPDFLIPNGISPNNDEANEYWEIKGIERYPLNEVLIFDPVGRKVLQVTSYKNEWNGYNMHLEPLPDGTYYYILKLNDKSNSIYTGFVVIFRG